jgi:hypothetical protein
MAGLSDFDLYKPRVVTNRWLRNFRKATEIAWASGIYDLIVARQAFRIGWRWMI